MHHYAYNGWSTTKCARHKGKLRRCCFPGARVYNRSTVKVAHCAARAEADRRRILNRRIYRHYAGHDARSTEKGEGQQQAAAAFYADITRARRKQLGYQQFSPSMASNCRRVMTTKLPR